MTKRIIDTKEIRLLKQKLNKLNKDCLEFKKLSNEINKLRTEQEKNKRKKKNKKKDV